MLNNMKFITCFIKKKKNNIFISFYFSKKIEYYNLGTLIKSKLSGLPMVFLIEKIFSLIILKTRQYNSKFINLISNDNRFFLRNIIQLLFLNFNKYGIKLLKFTFIINIPHNGCKQKKNVILKKRYL